MKNVLLIILLFVLCIVVFCACANKGPNTTNTGPSPSYTETLTPTIPYSTPVEPVYPDSRPPVLTTGETTPSPKPR